MPSSGRDSPLFLGRGGTVDGQQRQVLYLSAGLAARSSAPVVALDCDGPLSDELAAIGIEVHHCRMSSWRAYTRIVQRYIDAYRLVKMSSGRAICVVHGHDVWRAEYARLVARRLRVPYIIHVRGPLSSRDIQKHRLTLADSVVAISQRYADDLIAGGVEHQRVTLIDDSVDPSLFNPATVSPTLLGNRKAATGSPMIGFVGRIAPVKRVCEFLEIVALLPAYTTARPQIVIAGEWTDPTYKREVEARVSRLGLEQTVEFLGRCPSHEMPNFLAGIDVLVTLSGGSVMFEAMAMAKAVLSIRTDRRYSVHTRHNETAWCANSTEKSICAKELARLTDDSKLRHRLGEAARDWAVRNLSVEAMVTKTADLYDRLVRIGPRL
jgi:glycosyltransferase involved in cell wall biosynthesis